MSEPGREGKRAVAPDLSSLDVSSGVGAIAEHSSSVALAPEAGVLLPNHVIPSWGSLEAALPESFQQELGRLIEAVVAQEDIEGSYAALEQRYESIKAEVAVATGLSPEDIPLEAVIESMAMDTLLDKPEVLSRALSSIEEAAKAHATEEQQSHDSRSTFFGMGRRLNASLEIFGEPASSQGRRITPLPSGFKPEEALESAAASPERLELGDGAGYAMVRRVSTSRGITGRRKSETEDEFGVGLGSSELEAERGGEG